MNIIEEEVLKQIQQNQKYIDDNFQYNYELVEEYISNLLKDGKVNFDCLKAIMTIEYFQDVKEELKVNCDNYNSLVIIRKVFESDWQNIDFLVIDEIVNSSSDELKNFFYDNGIDSEKLKKINDLLKIDSTSINKESISKYPIYFKDIINSRLKIVESNLNELIKTLNVKLSELKYQEYDSVNNHRNNKKKKLKIYRKIKEASENIVKLNRFLDKFLVADELIPAKDFESFNELIDFILKSGIDDENKSHIIIELYNMNRDYVNSLINVAIDDMQREIESNAAEVMDELTHENTQQELPIEYEVLDISKIISNDEIKKLDLSETEMEQFNIVISHIINYLEVNSVDSRIFTNPINDYIANEINNDSTISRMDFISDNNVMQWNYIIYDLHANRNSKDSVLDIVNSVISKLGDIEREKINTEHFEEVLVLLNEIDLYIVELSKMYDSKNEDGLNELLNRFYGMKEKLNNLDVENEEVYNRALEEYENLIISFNEYYDDATLEEEINTSFNSDSNYIYFDEKVKKQLDKYPGTFYLNRIIYCINTLRSKEKLGHVSKDEKVKTLNGGVKGMSEVKRLPMRLYYIKIDNNSYYVSGIAKKDKTRSKIYDTRLRKYAKDGKESVKKIKEEMKKMNQAQIHLMFEDNYNSMVAEINKRVKNKDNNQLGGGSNGSN